MRSATVFSAILAAAGLAAAQTGALGDALVVTNNPIGASYIAKLPDKKTTTVRGSVAAHSHPDGKGVDFEVHIDGLPDEGGPFLYHIHDQPVPADGNCTGTLAHLDPFIRGETPPCDASAPQTCQVGDLSGKHGTINETKFTAHYTDLYAALVPGIGAFFGNRSVVVHFANKTRITCANFTELSGGKETGSYSSKSALPSTSYSVSTAAPSSTSPCSTLITATPYSSSSPPAVYTSPPTSSTPSNTTVTTSSVPLAQTANAAMNMVAPLPFAIAVAAAAFL